MDINRIIRAANAIVGGDGLPSRLDRALTELRTLQGSAAQEVEDAIGPIIEDATEALEVGDREAQVDVAWRIIRYREHARETGIR